MQVVNKAASVIISMLKGVHMPGAERHMWGCDTHGEKNDTGNSKQVEIIRRKRFGPSAQRLEAELLPFSLFFTQSSWRSGFPQNKPPTGCLSRPLINPSVGSLLCSQPSEQGSNPAKQRLSSCRPTEEESQVLFHCSRFKKKKKKLFRASQLQSKCKNMSKVTLFFF